MPSRRRRSSERDMSIILICVGEVPVPALEPACPWFRRRHVDFPVFTRPESCATKLLLFALSAEEGERQVGIAASVGAQRKIEPHPLRCVGRRIGEEVPNMKGA